ncbi:MAG: hypothetical protein AAF515_02895 [Pseudomonadota bacterium]
MKPISKTTLTTAALASLAFSPLAAAHHHAEATLGSGTIGLLLMMLGVLLATVALVLDRHDGSPPDARRTLRKSAARLNPLPLLTRASKLGANAP